MRRKKEIIRGIRILLKAKDLSPKEEKRLQVYLEKKKQLDAIPQQPCKNPKCDVMVPVPMVYCSSTCWREHNEH